MDNKEHGLPSVETRSPTLFKDDRGRSIKILIESEGEKTILENYVTACGGLFVCTRLKADMIFPIGKYGGRQRSTNSFKIQWLYDCIRENEFLDTTAYEYTDDNSEAVGPSLAKRKSNLPSDYLNTDSESDANADARPERKRTGGRPKAITFLHREDKDILAYIKQNNCYASVGGNDMWKLMERDARFTTRTWQSLKNRFKNSISKRLNTFHLSSDELKRFKMKEVDPNGPVSPSNEKAYTKKENEAILKYLERTNKYDAVMGKVLWQDLVRYNIVDRSWESSRDHFRRYIYPRLCDFKYLYTPERFVQVTSYLEAKMPASSIEMKKEYERKSRNASESAKTFAGKGTRSSVKRSQRDLSDGQSDSSVVVTPKNRPMRRIDDDCDSSAVAASVGIGSCSIVCEKLPDDLISNFLPLQSEEVPSDAVNCQVDLGPNEAGTSRTAVEPSEAAISISQMDAEINKAGTSRMNADASSTGTSRMDVEPNETSRICVESNEADASRAEVELSEAGGTRVQVVLIETGTSRVGVIQNEAGSSQASINAASVVNPQDKPAGTPKLLISPPRIVGAQNEMLKKKSRLFPLVIPNKTPKNTVEPKMAEKKDGGADELPPKPVEKLAVAKPTYSYRDSVNKDGFASRKSPDFQPPDNVINKIPKTAPAARTPTITPLATPVPVTQTPTAVPRAEAAKVVMGTTPVKNAPVLGKAGGSSLAHKLVPFVPSPNPVVRPDSNMKAKPVKSAQKCNATRTLRMTEANATTPVQKTASSTAKPKSSVAKAKRPRHSVNVLVSKTKERDTSDGSNVNEFSSPISNRRVSLSESFDTSSPGSQRRFKIGKLLQSYSFASPSPIDMSDKLTDRDWSSPAKQSAKKRGTSTGDGEMSTSTSSQVNKRRRLSTEASDSDRTRRLSSISGESGDVSESVLSTPVGTRQRKDSSSAQNVRSVKTKDSRNVIASKKEKQRASTPASVVSNGNLLIAAERTAELKRSPELGTRSSGGCRARLEERGETLVLVLDDISDLSPGLQSQLRQGSMSGCKVLLDLQDACDDDDVFESTPYCKFKVEHNDFSDFNLSLMGESC